MNRYIIEPLHIVKDIYVYAVKDTYNNTTIKEFASEDRAALHVNYLTVIQSLSDNIK